MPIADPYANQDWGAMKIIAKKALDHLKKIEGSEETDLKK